MKEEAAELLKKVLELSPEERADLASKVMDSLDATVDEDAEAAWQEEIMRRIEQVRSGQVKAIPWDEVRRKAQVLLHDPTRR